MASTDRIDIVLLGAGLSRRMGERNKLLLQFKGQPLIRHVAAQLVVIIDPLVVNLCRSRETITK